MFSAGVGERQRSVRHERGVGLSVAEAGSLARIVAVEGRIAEAERDQEKEAEEDS